MLLHIPEVLSAGQIADLRARLATADWQDGRRSAGHQALAVKHNRQLSGDDPLARELADQVGELLVGVERVGDGRRREIELERTALRPLPPGLTLGPQSTSMVFHNRYAQHAAHRWLRGLVGEVARSLHQIDIGEIIR